MKTVYCLLFLCIANFQLVAQAVPTLYTIGSSNKNLIKIDDNASDISSIFTLPITISSTNTLQGFDGNLIEASDKLVYGINSEAGPSSDGVIFRMYADGRNFEVIHEFDGVLSGATGVNPFSTLIEHTDGKLYGLTIGTGSTTAGLESGSVFRVDKDGSNFQTLHTFDGANERVPSGLIIASNNKLYGSCGLTGGFGGGYFYKMDLDGSNYTPLTFSDDLLAVGTLLELNGKIYGTSQVGGTNATFSPSVKDGFLFSVDLATDVITAVYNFDGSTGGYLPNNKVGLAYSNNKLFGITLWSAGGNGSLFSYDLQLSEYEELHNFSSNNSIFSSLTTANNGLIYGFQAFGGSRSTGILFSIDPQSESFAINTEFTGSTIRPTLAPLEINNVPPLLIGTISDIEVDEDAADVMIDLSTVFAPADEPGNLLEVSVSDNTNPSLFSSTAIDQGILTLDFADNLFGEAIITVQVLDSRGDFTETSFDVTVNPVADGTTVTVANAVYGAFNSSGLVIERDPADGSEVTHFKITNIAGGSLYLNDESTLLGDGDFVTVAQGILGLRFIGSQIGSGSFEVQASLSDEDAGLGGNIETASITVSPAILTVSTNDKSMVYGEALPVFDGVITGVTNGDDIIGTYSTDSDGSLAGTFAITATLNDPNNRLSNYEITNTSGTLTINKATLTVTASDASMTYGDTQLPDLSFSYSGFVNGDDESDIDTPPSGSSTSAGMTTDTGTYPINVNQDGSDNNYAFTYVDGTLIINKAELLVTPLHAEKKYGEANPVFTINYSNFLNGDDETFLDTTPTAVSTADETSAVGIYTITLSGGQDNNYNFIFDRANLTITKAQLNVIAEDASMTYGDATFPEFSIAYSGFVNGEDESVFDDPPNGIGTNATLTSDAGTYLIQVEQSGVDNNYDFNYVDGTLTITKAILTVTALDAGMTYGDAAFPNFSFDYSGFVNGEDESVLNDPPDGVDTNAMLSSDAGTYLIQVVQGGGDNNYDFNYVDGTLMISKAILTVTALDAGMTYGDSAFPDFSFEYLGFVNDEDESALDNAPNALETNATLTSDVGTYLVQIMQSGMDNNYDFRYVDGALTIGKAPLTATAEDQTINEGEDLPTLTITYTGFKLMDDVTDLDTQPTIRTTATAQSLAGAYPITLNGGSDNNYDFSLTDGTLMIREVLGLGENIIEVYPNPASAILKVEGLDYEELRLFDLEGKEVLKTDKQRVSVAEIGAGVYILRLYNQGKELHNQKIIIN